MVASPELIEELLQTLRAAVAANRATAARVGNVITLDDASANDVVVSADLHGHRHNFEQILRAADLDHHPRRHLLMQEVCHGGPTYPGGMGCMSHLMLEDVARLKARYPEQFHFLLSNHELSELTDFPILKSGKMLNLMFRSGIQQMYGDAGEAVREAYLEFIGSCPLAMRLANGVWISHSVPARIDNGVFDTQVFDRPLQPSDLASGGPAFELVWGRDFRQENIDCFAGKVDAQWFITGHEPCPAGYQTPNTRQLIIDSCGSQACFMTLPVCQGIDLEELVRRIEFLR